MQGHRATPWSKGSIKLLPQLFEADVVSKKHPDPTDWEAALLAQGVTPAQIDDVRLAAASLARAADELVPESTPGPDYLSFWQILRRLSQQQS